MIGLSVFGLVLNTALYLVAGREVNLDAMVLGVCVIGAVLVDRAMRHV